METRAFHHKQRVSWKIQEGVYCSLGRAVFPEPCLHLRLLRDQALGQPRIRHSRHSQGVSLHRHLQIFRAAFG